MVRLEGPEYELLLTFFEVPEDKDVKLTVVQVEMAKGTLWFAEMSNCIDMDGKTSVIICSSKRKKKGNYWLKTRQQKS